TVSQLGRIEVAGDKDFFQFTLTEPERLTARVEPTAGLDPVLTLFGPDGRLLITSDDEAAGDPTARIVQHLAPGTYALAVSASGAGEAGDYRLVAQVGRAIPPFSKLEVGDSPSAVLLGDFNGDGRPDLVTANVAPLAMPGSVSVLLGLGDGTFAPERRFPVGSQPAALVSSDFNEDGHLDLAVLDTFSSSIFLLLGRGDGTFEPQRPVAAGLL